MKRAITRRALLLGAGSFAWSSTALGGLDRPTAGVPDKQGVLYDTPVYDPESKSYFILVWARNPLDVSYGTDWLGCYNDARAREYKGVRGRMAIIDTPAKHEFLRRTFHPYEEAWIGLRYWCMKRQLQWSNGEYWKKGDFQAWALNYRQDVYACNSGASDVPQEKEYMPIAYNPLEQGFRWIGKGLGKRYGSYFLEFPVGKP